MNVAEMREQVVKCPKCGTLLENTAHGSICPQSGFGKGCSYGRLLPKVFRPAESEQIQELPEAKQVGKLWNIVGPEGGMFKRSRQGRRLVGSDDAPMVCETTKGLRVYQFKPIPDSCE